MLGNLYGDYPDSHTRNTLQQNIVKVKAEYQCATSEKCFAEDECWTAECIYI